jgi:DNA polymerase elongation subunit (family B)
LYGQTGSKISNIYCLPIAESTTAIGRDRLMLAKDIVESNFPKSKIIYGDTDSIFIKFNTTLPDGTKMDQQQAIEHCIKMGQEGEKIINKHISSPQKIVYEKTMYPLILIAKKKYVGNLYEKDPNKYVLKSMGIVLKRRDNSQIVKIIFGGLIDKILNGSTNREIIKFNNEILEKMFDNYFSIDNFIITKNLRENYANPQSIAHKVLADRIKLRDPGNAPHIGDRMEFLYIYKKINKNVKDVLQGDLIETPEYIKQHNLKIDNIYYLEHQIMNPCSQILNLILSETKVKEIYKNIIDKEKCKRLGITDITQWVDNNFNNDEICYTFLDESHAIKQEEKIKNGDICQWIEVDKNFKIQPQKKRSIRKKSNFSYEAIKFNYK